MEAGSKSYQDGIKTGLKMAMEIVDKILWANDGCDLVGRGSCSKACLEAIQHKLDEMEGRGK